MQLIFAADALHPNRIDEHFTPQVSAFLPTYGHPAVYSIEERRVSRVRPGETLLYRGWMLKSEEYLNLEALVAAAGGRLYTSHQQYLNAHHIPNWYPLLKEFTADTRVFPNEQLATMDIVAELQKLAWHQLFLKDYVKSLKTGEGSMVTHAGNAQRIINLMKHYRGGLEGGLVVRKGEPLFNEIRFFVLNKTAYAPEGLTPGRGEALILQAAMERIDSPFFSVDIALTPNHTPRLVEIGDGQVSDLVGWSPADFSYIFAPRAFSAKA